MGMSEDEEVLREFLSAPDCSGAADFSTIPLLDDSVNQFFR